MIVNLENLFDSLRLYSSEEYLSSLEQLKDNIQSFYENNPYRNKIADFDWIKTAIESLKKDNRVVSSEDFYQNSIIDLIQENIDLQDFIGMDDNEPKLKKLLNSALEGNNSFWNESVVNLINDWVYHFRSAFVLNELTIDENNIPHPEYIKQANALYSFETIEVVLPENNFDVDDNLNSFDKLIRANENNNVIFNVEFELTNEHYINNTNQSYLNLGIPKNSRRVNLMDLNRNFWVISQNVSYLLKYLFPSETRYTFSNMINKISKEIFELWENMIYLWATLYAIYGYEEHPLHFEFIYLPNDIYCTSRKFDNFDFQLNTIVQITNIKERLRFIIKKYPRHNLCIIPIIRADNYEYNYYSTEYYPGMFMKAYNEKDYNYISFENPYGTGTFIGATIDERIHRKKAHLVLLKGIGFMPKNFSNSIYNCTYIYPFNYVDSYRELMPATYTSVFRMVPEIQYTYINGILNITSLKFNYTDVIRKNIEQIKNNEIYGRFISMQSYSYNFLEPDTKNMNLAFETLSSATEYSMEGQNGSYIEEHIKKKKGTVINNYYTGEVLSANNTTQLSSFVFDKEIIKLQPSYGNYNIIQTTDKDVADSDVSLYEKNRISKIISKYSEDEKPSWTLLTQDDKAIIEFYAKRKFSLDNPDNVEDYSMGMVIGQHDLSFWGNLNSTYSYWGLNNAKTNILNKTAVLKQNQAYNLFRGATLYDPISMNFINYIDYIFYSTYAPGGNWISYTNSRDQWGAYLGGTRVWAGDIDNYAYLYVKRGEPLSNGNWVLRYVETCGTLSYANELLPLPSEFKQHEWGNIYDTSKKIGKKVSWDVWGIPDAKKPKVDFEYRSPYQKDNYHCIELRSLKKASQTDVTIEKLKQEVKNKKAQYFNEAISLRNNKILNLIGNGEGWTRFGNLLDTSLLNEVVEKYTITNPYSGEQLTYYRRSKTIEQIRALLNGDIFFEAAMGGSSPKKEYEFIGDLTQEELIEYCKYVSKEYLNEEESSTHTIGNYILYALFGKYYIWMKGKGYRGEGLGYTPATFEGAGLTNSKYIVNYPDETIGLLLDPPNKIQEAIDMWVSDFVRHCDERIKEYHRDYSDLVEHFTSDSDGERDILTSPIYSKIKTHLFFSNGNYFCKEDIQYGEERTKWQYYTVYNNNETDTGETYKRKRSLLPEKDNNDITSEYVLYANDAERPRRINGKDKITYLDYDLYPVTGMKPTSENTIHIPNPYIEST